MVRPLLAAVFLLLQAVISVRVELVAVPVTVTDARGRDVSGLDQENFRVFEDGRPRPIVAFHRRDIPVTLGLILDRSQSMRPKRAALLTASSAVLRSSRPGDELFVVAFNDRALLALADGRPFTSDADAIEAALTRVDAEGRTALYDGVADGLQHLQLGHGEKQVLIVVSDGGDNASRHTYAEVLELARRSNAVIYAIGLLGTAPAEEEEDAGLLERLCKGTGGAAYFPQTMDQVADVSTRIARNLRDQYTLGFVPGPRTAGPSFRKIQVTVTAAGHGRLRVRTRSGYVVAETNDQKGKS
jgi:Ca-activated chloride channel homolog